MLKYKQPISTRNDNKDIWFHKITQLHKSMHTHTIIKLQLITLHTLYKSCDHSIVIKKNYRTQNNIAS